MSRQSHGVPRRAFAPLPALVVLLLFLGGCGGGGSTPASPAGGAGAESGEETLGAAVSARELAGTNWQAVAFGSPGSAKPVDPATTLTLGFGVDRYAGTGGCNWFLGVYSVAGDQMVLNAPAQTVLQCSDPAGVMEQETMYLSALWNIEEYRKLDDKLLAYATGNQLLLTFAAAAPVALAGTNWSLKFQQEEDQMTALLPATQITATLADGRIQGSAGCSSYTAAYELDGDRLAISDLQVSPQLCDSPAGVMEQEKLYLANLAAAGGLVQSSGLLQLLDADGEPLLVFGVD